MIRAIASELADQLGTSLHDFGFTAEEVAAIARAAERDAIDYCLKS